MSPVATRRFRVLLQEVTLWKVYIEAPDAQAAQEFAENRLINVGTDGFTDCNGIIETIRCEEVDQ